MAAYTKEFAIEQIYLRVNRGQTTTETVVKREDLEMYLIAGIAWCWGISLNERLQTALRNKKYGIENDVSYNDIRITKYLTPKYDSRKASYYVDIVIPTVAGVQYYDACYVQGSKPIRKIEKRSDLAGIEDTVSDTCVYAINNPNPRLYFVNLTTCGDCEIEITSNIDYTQLTDTDLLPIPPDKELLLIDKCVQFFDAQKMGEDTAVDENDTPTEKA